jgi:hypothetical protein
MSDDFPLTELKPIRVRCVKPDWPSVGKIYETTMGIEPRFGTYFRRRVVLEDDSRLVEWLKKYGFEVEEK